jgi:hypothetical protein
MFKLLSLFDLTPTQLAVMGLIIGLPFALPLTIDQQNVFGNVMRIAMQMVLIVVAQEVLIGNALSSGQERAQTEASAANLQRQLDELSEKVIAAQRTLLFDVERAEQTAASTESMQSQIDKLTEMLAAMPE